MGLFGSSKKKQEKREKQEAFFEQYGLSLDRLLGRLPTEKEIAKYAGGSHSIVRYVEHVCNDDDSIVAFTLANHGDVHNMKFDGALVLTTKEIYFVHQGQDGVFEETAPLEKIKKYQVAPHGLAKNKLTFYAGRYKYEYHTIDTEKDGNPLLNKFKELIDNKSFEQKDMQKKKPAFDKYAEIERIHDMKEKGILTDEEYEKEKAKLLK
ncbi:SHOCT domain-containing protein [Marinococcus halophilus]|uniref:SHOCT domain-containing protein n=1 Tax=Marinococcus halophilus TaxID=1371 RepID=UPI0009A7B61F|nr:SHOCT domain-containing protein [Marinococcus halophilus]